MTDVIGRLMQKEIDIEVDKKLAEYDKKLTEKSKETARRLIKRGIDINAISEDTGLDIAIIEELKKEIG